MNSRSVGSFPSKEAPQRHSLPCELVISLTSYWKRLPWIKDTLDCLLNQTVQPDRLVLWVAHGDKAIVPQEVRAMDGNGLEIRYCEDTGPYKKLGPAIKDFPKAAVITADDDLWYSRYWAEDLLTTWTEMSSYVQDPEKYAVCHRAHGVTYDARRQRIQPYKEWEYEVEPVSFGKDYEAVAASASSRLFASSGTGLLLPPGPFGAALLEREELFHRLAPHTDDAAYFFAIGLAGMKTAMAPLPTCCAPYFIPQDAPLQFLNNDNRNDEAIRALSKAIGLPKAFLEETTLFPTRGETLATIEGRLCQGRVCLLG